MAFWSQWFGGKKPQPPAREAAPQAPEVPPDFPYELIPVPGSQTLELLEQLRQQASSFTPVILGDREDVQRIAEYAEFSGGRAEEIIRSAEAIEPAAWFRERQAEDPDYYQSEPGDWPYKDLEPHTPTAHLDVISHEPKPLVYVAKIPTPRSWEVPAYLRLGGWNECPPPEAQVAISRYWHEVYGAEVISATGEMLEYVVAQPPATREAALQLAEEQFLFCGDLIHQGMGNVTNLAAILLEGRYWYFWWD